MVLSERVARHGAVAQHHDAVAGRQHLRVVRHRHDGPRRVALEEARQEVTLDRRVEDVEDIIEQEEARLAGQAPREFHLTRHLRRQPAT